jgi:DNA primase
MAGRIPQSFIDQLLDRVDIVDVIDRRIKLKKTGKNYSACCPFHDEKSPSFSVNPEKQFYYCFGCQAGGNAIGFIMDYDNVDFPEAVTQLAQAAGLDVPREQGSANQPQVDVHKPLFNVLEAAAAFYTKQLSEHPSAHLATRYLQQRGLNKATADAFRLGFAPPGWDNLLKTLGTGPDDQKVLLDAGLLIHNDKGRTYDRFRERIIFPILDRKGRVIAFGGRVLGNDKPKYLNSPETPVFHKSRELYGLYQAKKSGLPIQRFVVVEGYMDVIALAQHGIHYAVATLGTATSTQHLEKLYQLVPEVVFCFDGDEAGRKAAFKALETVLPMMTDGRQARFLFLAEGEDPDSLVRKAGQQAFETLLDNAAPLERFLFDRLAHTIDTTSLEGRARLSKEAAPFLQRLPDGVFKELMFQDLAQRTGIDASSLKRLQGSSTASDDRGRNHQSDAHAIPFDAPPPTDAPPWQDEDVPPDYDSFFSATSVLQEGEPCAQSAGQTPAPSWETLVLRLLGLVAVEPGLALTLSPAQLPEGPSNGLDFLRQLIAQIEEQPDITPAMLLGFWYGTPEGDILARQRSKETDDAGEDAAEHRRALWDAMVAELGLVGHKSQVKARLEALKAKPYEQLGIEEKQELLALTRRIRELSKKR